MITNLKKLTFLLILFLTGCVSQKVSTLVGGDYDEVKNQTDYFEVPIGSVSMPGKWVKTRYNNVSGQQFFTNNDSIEISVAFNRYNRYEFNAAGKLKGYEFVKAYYEWDSKYFVDSHGLQRKIIEEDSINHVILYQIFGPITGGRLDTYFLAGEKNGNVAILSISITDKWTRDKKIDFLKKLYFKE